MYRHNPLWAILALLLLAACSKQPAPAKGPAVTPSSAEQPAASGVAKRTIRNGYGRALQTGDYVTVHTTGWLYDEAAPDHRGERFWSSLDNDQKLEFTLGEGRMIQGWDRGLPGSLIGEVVELTIPPELGYGAKGRGPIPPDSTLVFEIEIFGAKGPDE